MREPNLIIKCIRIMYFLYRRKIPLMPKLFQWFIRITCSADIPINIKIGEGSGACVLGNTIGKNAMIGANAVVIKVVF